MAQASPRPHRSPLVRLLAELAAMAPPGPAPDLAEGLGQWLDFKGALSLASVLKADAATGDSGPAAASADAPALREALARVRGGLSAAFSRDAVLDSAPAGNEPAAFAPYRQYYLARQRDMAGQVAALRAAARTALSRQSTSRRRLAMLDAVLEKAMAAREAGLLATLPGLLERRFTQLGRAHPLTGPGSPAQPEGWQATFRDELREVLLAELELRLQPVAGLIAALDNEESGHDE